MFMLSAQEAGTPDLGLWMVEAIEADCLTRDELALVASEPPPIREQTIVNLFGMARGKEALRCLRGLLSWTDHVQSLDQIKPPRSTMSMRTDGVLSTGTEGGQVDWGWRWRGHQGFASGFSGRWDWSSRSGVFPMVVVRQNFKKSAVFVGALATRIGQGVSLWSASAFDDLGGMEGSHRMASGIGWATSRQRGQVNGLGWRREGGGNVGHRWALIGRVWMGNGWTVACGGGDRKGWVLKANEVGPGEWRGSIGGYGGFERAGWSVRWGAAAFVKGLSARISVLKSWTSQWEGHFSLVLDHPDHPGWYSGEWRATVPDDDAVLAHLVTAGVEWKGAVSGWWRARWRAGMSPFRETDRRSSLRLSMRGHQLTFVVDLSPEWDGTETSNWTCRYRKNSQGKDGPLVWALLLGAGGDKASLGGVFGILARFNRPSGGRWRLGIAQAWGHPEAPVRYVTGWDRLPAQSFRNRDAHAFLRYTVPGGQLDWAIRLAIRSPTEPVSSQGSLGWAISWVGLEFRPGNLRRRGSARRYIARTELGNPLRTQSKQKKTMATTSDIKNGLCIRHQGGLYQVIEFLHKKTARGAGNVWTKMKNLENGKIIEHSYNTGSKIDVIRVETREHTYLYEDDMGYNFMNSETFEQIILEKHLIDNSQFLQDEMKCLIVFHAEEERPLSATLPSHIEAEVTYTEPGVKGDTATNTLKPATIDTGTEVRVPLFINIGDRIKVDTRTGDYSERVKK